MFRVRFQSNFSHAAPREGAPQAALERTDLVVVYMLRMLEAEGNADGDCEAVALALPYPRREGKGANVRREGYVELAFRSEEEFRDCALVALKGGEAVVGVLVGFLSYGGATRGVVADDLNYLEKLVLVVAEVTHHCPLSSFALAVL